MTRLVTRPVPLRARLMLEQAGLHPLLARLYAARGIQDATETDPQLKNLLQPDQLKGIDTAANLLADAIQGRQKILIVADYDCDGATACAVGLRALRAFGATVDYLVPNRFETGYGLSPEVARLAAAKQPDLLITVDNGIASVTGVAEAQRLGMRVIVTDHHLPGDTLPTAEAIVNPNQPGCTFPSKAIAGVGVMFYVMLALRAELRRRGHFSQPEPNLAELLDLVALGTVADVVQLDRNNRLLVINGINRIRQRKLQPGIQSLLQIAGREAERASTFDLGFALGPRLNAAGRLADMSLGIECLATDSLARALNIAQELDAINHERRAIEADMREAAAIQLDSLDPGQRASLTLFDPDWHQGVVGILAGRVKEQHHRPTFVFARGTACGELRGSGRSIPGLHLRDALDLVSKRHPDLLKKFGGHAAAAGLTLNEKDLSRFETAFEDVARSLLSPAQLTRTLETDGPLEEGYAQFATARLLQSAVWGQGFPAPLFADEFTVLQQRLLKDKHLKLTLQRGKARYEAIRFNHAEPAPEHIRAAFRLDINEWQGEARVQFVIEYFEPA